LLGTAIVITRPGHQNT